MRRSCIVLCISLLLGAVLTGCTPSRPKPEMDFTAEQKGQGLVIRVQIQGDFRIPEDGHIHIRLNDGPETMAFGTTYTIPELEPGKYKIFVELGDLNHRPIGVDKTKEIEIHPVSQ